MTCLHFRIQKNGSLKVYIDDVSRASYESSQYCVSFTDLPHLEKQEEEGNITLADLAMMGENITAMSLVEDPDLFKDCSDTYFYKPHLHNGLLIINNLSQNCTDIAF